MLIDTHCHLDFPEFDQDRGAVIARSKEAGVEFMVNIGSSLKGSEQSIALAKEYGFIYASVGIHPHEADTSGSEFLSKLKELAQQKKVVAIGETGLDYFKNFSTVENQKKLFFSLVGMAKELGLPLVIHCRDSEDDVLEILKKNSALKAVVHCFSGSRDFLASCLDLGFYVSFTCNITYKKAEDLRSLVKITPLERLMLETDAPYLSPEGFRGKRNEPLQVKLLADYIAMIKGISTEEVAEETTKNAKSFFGLLQERG